MIPIHLKKPGDSPPSTTHYMVARNGLFLSKKEWWVEAVVPVEQIAVLDDQEVFACLLMPSLPAEVLAKALKVARQVYEMSRSEVCLLIHYHKETGYQLSMPIQQVSPGHVKYGASERLPGHLCVGTIHSHGSLAAFHSATDHQDEVYWDGVHVTVGDMASYPQFSISVEMVVSGIRFPVDVGWFEDLLPASQPPLYQLDHSRVEQWKIPKEWLARVKQPRRLMFHRKGGK